MQNQSRRTFMKSLGAGMAMMSSLGISSFGESNKHPNVILIIGDDISWDDFGCYGHPTIRTPNVDKLAADGIRFTNTYLTASSCSPSRCSVITGRYPTTLVLLSYTRRYRKNKSLSRYCLKKTDIIAHRQENGTWGMKPNVLLTKCVMTGKRQARR